MRKLPFHHPALDYYDPQTGQYDEEKFGEDPWLVDHETIVCPVCNGTGSHVRRDIDDSALVDNMIEDGDFEGIEGYFKGDFDVICTECNGNNVVHVPVLPEWAWDLIRDWEYQADESNRIQAAERRMGA